MKRCEKHITRRFRIALGGCAQQQKACQNIQQAILRETVRKEERYRNRDKKSQKRLKYV